MSRREQQLAAFSRLLDIMDDLREKCPWDRKQTMESLRILTIEEMYELAEAITQYDMGSIKEELGDLLLHIIFYAKIADEQHQFDIGSLINQLCEKLIVRHPHIYGNVSVNNEEEVKQNWEAIKQRTSTKEKKGLLSGVPAALPALVKAYRMQDKAKQVGFEWDNTEQVWNKVEEELGELKEAINQGTDLERKKEFGDVLFALVNYARFIHVDPEAALADTNNKFYNRFTLMEDKASEKGLQLKDMTLAQMDALWNETKRVFP
ncbi:MAG: nucleoside triphosphate pyrophosphohydrolase [Bacteroidota bacterium]|jgi:XTP/dITP diphosphohydrolase